MGFIEGKVSDVASHLRRDLAGGKDRGVSDWKER